MNEQTVVTYLLLFRFNLEVNYNHRLRWLDRCHLLKDHSNCCSENFKFSFAEVKTNVL